MTSDGVSFLFNCKAIEDLLLRHNVSILLVLVLTTTKIGLIKISA